MAAKLFLGGISPNTTTEAIESHFAKYGTVVDAVVMYKDGKHRGFGFVTFDSPECVSLALAEEQVIDGRTVDVKPAVPQGEAPPPRSDNFISSFPGAPMPPKNGPACDKVFIGGLAQTTTDEMVQQYFSQYGVIVDCVVMKDRGSNRSRGFGFVQFDSPNPVEQIIADYANHHIEGKWVEVKKAVPQDQMPPGASRGMPCGKGYGGKGASPAIWAGRSPYGAPPPAYPVYGHPVPQYSMAAYSPYGVYPSYHHPGAYAASRGAMRGRPY